MNALSAIATGPRTAKGKAKSSRNATKHGLTAALVLAPGERLAAFESLVAALTDSLQPVGELETLLVERVSLCAWRLRRVARLEVAYVTSKAEAHAHRADHGLAFDTEGLSSQGVEGTHVRAQAEVFVNLSRYEAALERSMYRALHELERAQAARGGQVVPVPAVLDVQVSRAGDDP